MSISEFRPVESSCKRCWFIRVTPDNLQKTLEDVLFSLKDFSWLEVLEQSYLREGYERRARSTLSQIEREIRAGGDGGITKDAGEYLVSVLATNAIESELNYSKLPLGELREKKIRGNPGFDFHNVNHEDGVLIFGEAKYRSRNSAHKAALSQIHDFINDGKDVVDLPDLGYFCPDEVLDNVTQGVKGFAAAFSSRSTTSARLIEIITSDEHFKFIENYDEIVLIAIDL